MSEEMPTPWQTSEGIIQDSRGEFVARTWEKDACWGPSRDIRIAHRIVRAVNAHEALVEACEAALAEHDMFVGGDCGCGVFSQMRDAVKLAKG